MKKILFILTFLAVSSGLYATSDNTWRSNKVWWIDRGDWLWRDYHPVGFSESLSTLHAQDVTCNPNSNNCSSGLSTDRYIARQTAVDPDDIYPDESAFTPWEDEDCENCSNNK